MATYFPNTFGIIGPISASFPGAFSGPTLLYSVPANRFALLNVSAGIPFDSSSADLLIDGRLVVSINRTNANVYVTRGFLYNATGGTQPINLITMLLVVGPGQSLTRSSPVLAVSFTGVLLGT